MAHPYKAQARDSAPKWQKGLERYRESKSADMKATVRNHGGNPAVSALAAYEGSNRMRGGRADGGEIETAAQFYTDADKDRLGSLTYPRTPKMTDLNAASSRDRQMANAIRADNYEAKSLTNSYPAKNSGGKIKKGK